MPDAVLPLLKEAFDHADNCSTETDGVIDTLEQALEVLPESDSEIRASISQVMEKAFHLQDAWSELSRNLQELRLKYRASYMPSPLAPEVDELLDVLARIEARRRSIKPVQE